MKTPPPRIIPRLDIKGPNVIKGIHLEGLRIVGQPGAMASEYYHKGADEIIFMDSVASLYGRNSILPVIQEAAGEIFVPLTVGGGIKEIDDIVSALRSGADKVAINTAAISRKEFIQEAANIFGSQCIVLSVEAKHRGENIWEALANNGRERTGINVLDWVQEAEQLGAGEILVTSVDMDGTCRGFDLPLLQSVRRKVNIPIIGCGGAGSPTHVIQIIGDNSVDAVACGSIFHYGHSTVSGLKSHLADEGFVVRPMRIAE